MRVLREGWMSAWSQPVASLLTAVMVAGMCVAVLLTTGRTAAAEEAAISQIDAAGTRSVVVRAAEEADIDPGVGERIAAIDDVERVTVLGPLRDVHNAAVDGASPVGMRTVHSGLDVPAPVAGQATALASAAGAERLGLRDGVGLAVDDVGRELSVVGHSEVPAHLTFLEPLVVTAAGPQEHAAMIVVLVAEPHMVAPVAEAVAGMLDTTDPQLVTVETSERLAAVRAAVAGELGSAARETVLGILAVAGLLVAANLTGLVMLRRRDFGRRRALGASQGLVMGLLLTQVTILAVLGAAVGTIGTLGVLLATGSPVPGPEFSVAVAVAAVLTAVVAALVPAVMAARREPLYELRVP